MKIFTEASGSFVSSALIANLKKTNSKVIASDITEWNAGAGLADDYVVLPKFSDPNLWNFLKKILLEKKVDWVVPSINEMLLGWASELEELAKFKISLILSPKSTIKIFTDKWLTYEAFIKASIPTPKTSLQKNFSLIKPRFGRGSKGVKITNKNLKMDGFVSQEFLEGQELTVDCLFDQNGAPIYIVPRSRIRVVEGKSVVSKIIKHEKVNFLVEQLAKKYHFIGPVNVQCFVKDSDVKFTEVNPRVGGGMALSWAATENWFKLWFEKIIHKKKIQPKPIRYGMRMDRYYSELFTNPDEL